MPEPITLVTVPQVSRNLVQYAGIDKQFSFTVRGLDGVIPIDLTSWTAVAFTIHAYGDPNVVYLTKTLGSGVVFTDRLRGTLTVTVGSGDLDGMSVDGYQWRLERTDAGNDYVVEAGLYSLLTR